jgi:hypothetical protein
MLPEPDSRYQVFPFTRVAEGEDIVIGRPSVSAFLSVSRDIVAMLDWLDEGKSLAETRALYEQAIGDAEGLPEAIEALASRGFLIPESVGGPPGSGEGSLDDRPSGTALHPLLGIASALYGPQGLAVQFGLLALASALLWLDSGLIPNVRALFFDKNVTLTSLAVIALSLGTLSFHEIAHMAAAWRKGVRSRLGVSHRLWIPVVETDLSGLWSLPRGERLLPILAGPLADGVFCAMVVILLFGERRGWIQFSGVADTVLEAILTISALRILWQCLLFVRTDFYYALAHFLRCRNLIADTERYLAGLARFVVGLAATPDLSRLPLNERRAVRSYSVLWMLGRLMALVFLVRVQIPLLLHYVGLFLSTVAGRPSRSLYDLIDRLIMASFVLLANGLGFGLWIYNILRRNRDGEA